TSFDRQPITASQLAMAKQALAALTMADSLVHLVPPPPMSDTHCVLHSASVAPKRAPHSFSFLHPLSQVAAMSAPPPPPQPCITPTKNARPTIRPPTAVIVLFDMLISL